MEELKGLTTEEIEEKTKQGKTNKIKIKANESILKIIRKNIFTYFNLIFLILAILLITSQSYRNLTFLIIITINILIGIFQQIKSKITLDKLSLLDKNDYIVIRNGKKGKISSDNLVEGDYVILEAGNQIPADAVVVSGKMYVNESLLTGEQDEIEKNINSNLMSGSFVISGKSVVKLTKVGDESFSSKIMKDSKKIKETKSEMISAIDKIVKFAGIITSIKKKYTKNNKIMAFATLEDLYGSIEVIIFENCYLQCSNELIDENIVLVEGRLSIREDEDTKIVAREIKKFEDTKSKSLYINITNLSEEKKNQLRGALKFFTGDKNNVPVVIINGERNDSAGGLYVTKDILEELQEIVGQENAKIE